MESQYDLIVIGSGPGGYSTAIRAGQKGMKVAVVERLRIGGTCLNRGCIPTKTLLHCALQYASIHELPFLNGKVILSFAEVMKQKDGIILAMVNGIEAVMRNQGIQVFTGMATFRDGKTVEVKKEDGTLKIMRGKWVVIAPGAKPVYHPEVTPDREWICGTEEVLEWKDIPETLVSRQLSSVG